MEGRWQKINRVEMSLVFSTRSEMVPTLSERTGEGARAGSKHYYSNCRDL